MPTIELDLDTDLTTNNSSELTFNISPDEGNTLMIRPGDGLYAPSPSGMGTGYPDTTIVRDGVRIGFANPFDNTTSSHRVSLTSIVHRIYTSDEDKGKVLIDFRPEIDCILAGDMYRVKDGHGTWSYYLITWTSETSTGVGNQILSSIFLGSW
jgi:hypothetical protein